MTAVLGMAQALSEAGVKIRVLATDHGWRDPEGHRGFDIRICPCRFCPWRFSPKLAKALGEEAQWADLVHAHTLWGFPTLAALRASAWRHVPAILRPAGMLDAWSLGQRPWKKQPYLALFGRHLVDGVGAFHWTSSEECQSSPLVAADPRGFVIPLGLPPSVYRGLPDGTAFFDRFPNLLGRRVVLFLGRLHPKKQPDLVIRAFRAVHSEFHDAVLVLAGSGAPSHVKSLQTLVSRLHLDSVVSFIGMQHGREVQEAMVAARVFVLPSLQENFALAAAEAMAAGCPVILSSQVALARAVENHRAGLVVEADVSRVAEALRSVLGDPERARLMGENGRQLVLEQFMLDLVVPRLIAVYEDILRGIRTSPAWCHRSPNAEAIRSSGFRPPTS